MTNMLLDFYRFKHYSIGNQGEQQKGIKQTAAKAGTSCCFTSTKKRSFGANKNSKTRGHITQNFTAPSVRAKWTAVATESLRHTGHQSRCSAFGNSA